MERRPRNPIEQRKYDVRKYARNIVIQGGISLVAGVALAIINTSLSWLLLGVFIALVIGGFNAYRIKKIVNHVDDY